MRRDAKTRMTPCKYLIPKLQYLLILESLIDDFGRVRRHAVDEGSSLCCHGWTRNSCAAGDFSMSRQHSERVQKWVTIEGRSLTQANSLIVTVPEANVKGEEVL